MTEQTVITEDSFSYMPEGQARWVSMYVLKQYISIHGKSPTQEEYKSYKTDWYKQKAKMKCDVCGLIATNGSLTKASHKNSKKHQEALAQLTEPPQPHNRYYWEGPRS